jgi:predicted lysophospholipase L1 biosynthesis ABC-type transport system permease subunit
MKQMGFNVLILPAGQDLSDFYDQGYAAKLMPESYADKLANARIVTVRHLLPILERKIDWPEQKRKILLVGVRGEVPLAHRDPKKPIASAVPEGKIVLGHELARSAGFAEGDRLELMDRTFEVALVHEERGTVDDITAWVNLATAQEMLALPGQINAIKALECRCAWADLAKVREEIGAILPDTQVTHWAVAAVTRADARLRAQREAAAALEHEKRGRLEARAGLESFAGWLVPLVVAVAIVWVGVLALSNVRERTIEIGLFRALGLTGRRILLVFLAKAVLIGLVGAAAGVAAGLTVAGWFGQSSSSQWLLDPLLPIGVLAVSPLLSAAACLLPAILAARQDPAVILARE